MPHCMPRVAADHRAPLLVWQRRQSINSRQRIQGKVLRTTLSGHLMVVSLEQVGRADLRLRCSFAVQDASSGVLRASGILNAVPSTI